MKPCLVAAWIGLVGLSAARADGPPRFPVDPEMEAHLQGLQKTADDPHVDIGARERTVLEIASTLDRAAQSAPGVEVRRARWTAAVEVIDRFLKANPGQSLERALQVQAAVYEWARGRSWAEPSRVSLADQSAREHAAADLEAAARRLRPVVQAMAGADDVYEQNARYRLAQALADLAIVGIGDARARLTWNEEALTVIAAPVKEPSLAGFAYLLRADLLARLGRYDEAQAHLDASAASDPAPVLVDRTDVQVAVHDGRGRFDAARKAVDDSGLPETTRQVLKVRIDLDEWKARPAGAERDAAESALFRDLKAAQPGGGIDGRAALVAVAEAIVEPGAAQGPSAWDLLADGALQRGQTERAATLEERAANLASTAGDAALAASLRLKSGAAWFQAGKFIQAASVLGRVAEDPKAGDLRPRAGLLRVVALGRALAVKAPGASTDAYSTALKFQIDSFPTDPTGYEARWLLGKLRIVAGGTGEAIALWESIGHGSPRWLESRREIARLRQEELDAGRLAGDRDETARRATVARDFLDDCLKTARGDDETNELLLAKARLELTPGLGRVDQARDAVERVLRSAARPAQRELARSYQVIVLAHASRYVEAEQIARRETAAFGQLGPDLILSIVGLLDRTAAESESDLRTRRMGLLMGLLLAPLARSSDDLSPPQRAEVRLREVRAQMFSGDDEGARRSIAGWAPSALSGNNDLLRDLAETYVRLEAFSLAADVQRLRGRQLPTGSVPWLDARYGLALALYRSGDPKHALDLIDATAILHPELGGGELREKFIRLRQKLGPHE